jgi:hypothetical protein
MDPAVPQRPFPSLLSLALVVPTVLFVPGCIGMIWNQHSGSVLVFALFVIPMMMALGAVSIAVLLLMLGGYRTNRNVVLTWIGAIPVLVLFGIFLFYHFTHWHI